MGTPSKDALLRYLEDSDSNMLQTLAAESKKPKSAWSFAALEALFFRSRFWKKKARRKGWVLAYHHAKYFMDKLVSHFQRFRGTHLCGPVLGLAAAGRLF